MQKAPAAPLLETTLAKVLTQTAARFPDRQALIVRHQDLRYTWSDFDKLVTRVARGLSGLGLRVQDRVDILASNCAEWILLQYACARAGFVLVNVNPAYRAHELSFVLGKSKMRALFLWEKDARSSYQQILDQARKTEHALEHIIHLGTSEWHSMINQGAALPAASVLPNHPTNIQYTSG